MRRLLPACLLFLPVMAHAESWAPSTCGDEPVPPKYTLTTREAYNDAVKKVNAYQAVARAYSDCVLKEAHSAQSAISHAAQNKIADIQTVAVGTQQDIYGRFAAQAAAFKAAAKKLSAK